MFILVTIPDKWFINNSYILCKVHIMTNFCRHILTVCIRKLKGTTELTYLKVFCTLWINKLEKIVKANTETENFSSTSIN